MDTELWARILVFSRKARAFPVGTAEEPSFQGCPQGGPGAPTVPALLHSRDSGLPEAPGPGARTAAPGVSTEACAAGAQKGGRAPGAASTVSRQSRWHGLWTLPRGSTCHSATKEAHPFPLSRNGSWSSRSRNSRNSGLTSNMSLCTSNQALAQLIGPHDSQQGGHPHHPISQRGRRGQAG